MCSDLEDIQTILKTFVKKFAAIFTLISSQNRTMHETNAEFGTREEENVLGIWAFGLIFIVLGAIAILYCLRYVGSVRSLLAKHNKQNTVMMAPAFENE